MRTCAADNKTHLKTLPPACLRSWTRINFAGMPAIKTGMTNVGGHLCSHIGTVSQAEPAAMSQVHRRHMRTRLNVRSNLRRYTNLSDPARNTATTPTCSHFSWYTSHGSHLGQLKYKNKEQQQFARSESGRMYTAHSPLFFRKIVDIERFALRATVLDECQIYLGGGGQFGRRSPSLASFHPPL